MKEHLFFCVADFIFCFSVLVALYEETEKPNNALEYPYTAAQPEPQPAIAYCFLFQKRHAHPYDEGEAL